VRRPQIADGDGCSHDCKPEFCGDGIVNDARPAALLTPATCNIDCTISSCGDGKLNPWRARPSSATTTTPPAATGAGDLHARHCGNGVVDAFEECDAPTPAPSRARPPAARRSAATASSKNAAHAVSEQCDDGTAAAATAVGHLPVRVPRRRLRQQRRALRPRGDAGDLQLDCTPSTCGDGKMNAFAIPPESATTAQGLR
jgi:hypothetical protein